LGLAARLRWLHVDGNRLTHVLPFGGWPCRGDGGAGGGGAPPPSSLHTLSAVDNAVCAIEEPLTSGARGCKVSSGEPQHAAPAGAEAPGGSLARWCGSSLCELRLAGNRLEGLAGLSGCCMLQVVDVRRNRLTSLKVGASTARVQAARRPCP
jgi:hypothetical protein